MVVLMVIKPLDIEVSADGTMYIATFTCIWRITPQ